MLAVDDRRIAALEPGEFRALLERAHGHERAGQPRAAAGHPEREMITALAAGVGEYYGELSAYARGAG